MAFNRARFLIDVLGPEGAKALAKAASRSSLLGHALVPRTIVAWLRANSSYNGEIPGSEQWVSFAKSERGFTGCVSISDQKYEFQDVSLFHVAGAVGVAVGMDSASVPKQVRNLDLERLGKSIDLMVRVRQLNLAKQEREEDEEEEKLKKKAVNEGGSGTQAAPIAPKAPEAPTAVSPQPTTKQVSPLKPKTTPKTPAPVTPKVAKPPAVKMARSEMGKPCPICSLKQFEGDEFVGCVCFRALQKSVHVVSSNDDFVELELGEGWDRESVVTLLEAVGRK